MTAPFGTSHWLVTVTGPEEDHGIILHYRNWVWEALGHLMPLLTGTNGEVSEEWRSTYPQVLAVPCQWDDPIRLAATDGLDETDSSSLQVYDSDRDCWRDLQTVEDSLVVGQWHDLVTFPHSMGWGPSYGAQPSHATSAALKRTMAGRPTCRLRHLRIPLQVWYHPHREAAPEETGACDLWLVASHCQLPEFDPHQVSQITVRPDLFLCPV